MRGCDKFCTFCVVPFTRGRERSRSLDSIVEEVRTLAGQGFREVTLLGQNVNSYRDGAHDFAALMKAVAAVDRSMRVRFTTSHPQDMSEALIDAIASTDNICKYIHLPVQSGSDRILGADEPHLHRRAVPAAGREDPEHDPRRESFHGYHLRISRPRPKKSTG